MNDRHTAYYKRRNRGDVIMWITLCGIECDDDTKTVPLFEVEHGTTKPTCLGCILVNFANKAEAA